MTNDEKFESLVRCRSLSYHSECEKRGLSKSSHCYHFDTFDNYSNIFEDFVRNKFGSNDGEEACFYDIMLHVANDMDVSYKCNWDGTSLHNRAFHELWYGNYGALNGDSKETAYHKWMYNDKSKRKTMLDLCYESCSYIYWEDYYED